MSGDGHGYLCCGGGGTVVKLPSEKCLPLSLSQTPEFKTVFRFFIGEGTWSTIRCLEVVFA